MPTYKKKPNFFSSEEGLLAWQALEDMVGNDLYHTEPSYSANAMLYPDNLIPFIDKHMVYMRDHPNIDPQLYLSNLRLMTRVGR